MSPPSDSLTRRLALRTVAPLGLMLFIGSIVLTLYSEGLDQQRFDDRLRSITNADNESLACRIIDLRDREADLALRGRLQQSDYADLLELDIHSDRTGERVFKYRRPGTQSLSRGPEHVVPVMARSLSSEARIGHMTFRRKSTFARTLAGSSLLICVSLLSLTLILARAIRREVLEPLSEITTGLSGISSHSGDIEALQVAAHGELSTLQGDINAMLARLRHAAEQQLADRQKVDQLSAALTEQYRYTDSILQHSRDGIILIDQQGNPAFANRMFRELFVLGAEPLRMTTSQLVSHVDAQLEPGSACSLALQQATEEGKVEASPKGHSERKLELEARSLTTEQGRYILMMVRDVTDQVRARSAEERLRHAQKMEAIGRLAGGIAHDFNNLLTVTLPAAHELVLLHEEGTEEHSLGMVILESSKMAASMTRQLLLFSRQRKAVRRPIDLRQLLIKTTSLLERLSPDEVNLKISLPDSPIVAVVDHGEIEQILVNMTINACDAMPSGGQLEISLEAASEVPDSSRLHGADSVILLEFTDTGLGIAADVLPKIFEPFFTTKAEGQGTGLGLATVYELVQQCGGEMSVNSTLGVGSTFSVFLPQSEYEQPVQEVLPEQALAGSEEVLLVEDNSSVRGMVCRMLDRLSVNYRSAENPEAALALIAANSWRPTVLISDVSMPGMSGPELAEQIRQQCSDLHVLYISGYDQGLLSELSPNEEFLCKPFTASDLGKAIFELLA